MTRVHVRQSPTPTRRFTATRRLLAIAGLLLLTVPMMVGTSVVMVGVYLTNRKTVSAPE